MAEHHTYTNRLIKEKSPYLQQHAHNPVDWYPWSDEAFNAARELDKPIFLSIGYATCHWCHVMEEESFEDVDVAKMLNETFINIKVDREELPEVDSLYMEFAQSMMSGSAGWPLNMVLTPNLEPFFATTYLPPYPSQGLMGLVELIDKIKEVWRGEEREQLQEQASKIVEVFSENVHIKGDSLPENEQAQNTAALLYKLADPVYGGLKGMPKFPVGYQSNFLLLHSVLTKDSRALFLVERTLDMMQRGGIYDHLGGGFSRYSVDDKWLVPHFEKMLYDNALLAYSYLEAWQLTQKPLYKQICQDVCGYILRDMTHVGGGFYSAEDADSEGHEGYFYTWDYEEIQKVLGAERAELFCEYYGITPEGNFEGRNILHIKLRLEEFAEKLGLDPRIVESEIKECRQILWEIREKRPHPFKDDKILSAWNGLMIHTLAQAGAAFENESYLKAAKEAAQFVRKNLWEEKQLLRRWRDGESSFSGGLDEYAFMIRGLISLFEADQGEEWLAWAIEMAQILDSQFKNEGGGYYQTDGTDPNIILRKCQFSDGAEPSGNSIHCENLLRLYQITLQTHYLRQAEDILKAVKEFVDSHSPGYCYHCMNIYRYYDVTATTFVVALNDRNENRDAIRKIIFKSFRPHKSVVWSRGADRCLKEIVPYLEDKHPINGQTTVYPCHLGACQKPVQSIEEISTIN